LSHSPQKAKKITISLFRPKTIVLAFAQFSFRVRSSGCWIRFVLVQFDCVHSLPSYKTDPIYKTDLISTTDPIHKTDPISKTDHIHKTDPISKPTKSEKQILSLKLTLCSIAAALVPADFCL
jgi:hypothetical protein